MLVRSKDFSKHFKANGNPTYFLQQGETKLAQVTTWTYTRRNYTVFWWTTSLIYHFTKKLPLV